MGESLDEEKIESKSNEKQKMIDLKLDGVHFLAIFLLSIELCQNGGYHPLQP